MAATSAVTPEGPVELAAGGRHAFPPASAKPSGIRRKVSRSQSQRFGKYSVVQQLTCRRTQSVSLLQFDLVGFTNLSAQLGPH